MWQALRKSPQSFKGLVKLAQDPEALKAVLQSVPDLWKVADDHFEVMWQALAHNLDLVGNALFGDGTEKIALAGVSGFSVFMGKVEDESLELIKAGGKFILDDSEKSGPWVDDALKIMKDGQEVVVQSTTGSCVSATGAMLTHGQVTEAELLKDLGDWSNNIALRDELNKLLGSGTYASKVFKDGTEAAKFLSDYTEIAGMVKTFDSPAHFVFIETIPGKVGTYLVKDPWPPGLSYVVDVKWLDKYLNAGVYKVK